MAKVQYTIRVEPEILEDAKKVADDEMRSLNNLIEYFIAKGIEDHYRLEKIKTTLENEN